MSCAFQPSYGKVYRLVSHKIVFSAALVIFELGSVVCAVSRTSIVFILGRALAGLGSAGIQAGTTLLIADCVPLRQRPTYNSIIGSIFAVGSVAGPLMVTTTPISSLNMSANPNLRVAPSPIRRHGAGVSMSIYPSAAQCYYLSHCFTHNIRNVRTNGVALISGLRLPDLTSPGRWYLSPPLSACSWHLHGAGANMLGTTLTALAC